MTTTAIPRKTIAQAFQTARDSRRIALMPFIPAGFPDLQTTAETIRAAEGGGADILEIGIPFSDPIADGPVIQEAFTAALSRGLKLDQVFSTIAAVRPAVGLPLVAMVSFSIIFRHGIDRFMREARSSGFDGVIIPDLPPPEARPVCDIVRAAGLDTVLLIAPTTSPQRRAEIAQLCSGFIYYLSISGITGERQQLPPDLRANVEQIKQATNRPVCVGFGINKPEHVKQLADFADGAIIGSAVVRRMRENAAGGPAAVAAAAASYCRELLRGAAR